VFPSDWSQENITEGYGFDDYYTKLAKRGDNYTDHIKLYFGGSDTTDRYWDDFLTSKSAIGVQVNEPEVSAYIQYYKDMNNTACFAVEEPMKPLTVSLAFRDYAAEEFLQKTQTLAEAGFIVFWYKLIIWMSIHDFIRKGTAAAEAPIQLDSKVMTVFTLSGVLLGASVLVFIIELAVSSCTQTSVTMLKPTKSKVESRLRIVYLP
jgi:hypothetical protein